MKVILIDEDLYKISKLTFGKFYDVIDTKNDYIKIMNDSGHLVWYRKEFFKTQEEIRREKFNNLGI